MIKYKDENINDLLVQLEASKPVVKDLLRDLLIKMKGFYHQVPMKVLLSKQKENGDIKLTIVYLDSTAKTVIASEYDLNKSFQKILYRLDN